MARQSSIYAFFVRAENRSVAMMIDTSSEEKWKNNIRSAVRMPDAEIDLIHESDWKAPAIKSVNEDANTYIEGIQDYCTSQKLSPMSKDDFLREHLGDMKSAITGLVVVLVKHPSYTQRGH